MGVRDTLPQLSGDRLFITDGGMETTLIFARGLELPSFAAFPLATEDTGRTMLREYFAPFVALARRHGTGLLVDTPTWRANPDWGERLGYDPPALAEANRAGAAIAAEVADSARGEIPVLVSGAIGPRGDGYVAARLMTAGEAQRYHAVQIQTFAQTTVDVVTALTMTYAEEATGVVRAAREADLPAVVSFTVETDGRLPSGQSLREAVEQVDEDTGGAAAYFMVNCAHPTHFASVLEEDGDWRDRIRGIRANASRLSHQELDEADELDAGDPQDLAARYRDLRAALPSITVVGGCCGTDERHVAAICAALTS
jgi:homocysteine S-methyltransferase